MKKMKLIPLLLCLSLLLGSLSLPAAAQTDPSVTGGCHSIDAARPLAKNEKLLATSKAVVLYERKSGTLIYTWNADNKIYPSSMVKLMTVLVALEMGNLADTVTVTRRALNGLNGGKLVSGEQLTLEQLLYMAMVESANDAAAVIAEYVSGTQEAFVKLMNEKAAALGCKGTNFSNPHGLHDAQTYTTARDLCRILEYGLQNETFKKLFSTARYTIPATNKSPEPREIMTTNRMMLTGHKKYYDPRVTGGRTGFTDEAGRCLAITAEGSGMELIAIVMGAQQTLEPNGLAVETFGSFEEMKVLLDHAIENYEYRQVFLKNQTISQHSVAGGTNDVVTMPKTALSTVLPKAVTPEELTWVYANQTVNLTAPVEKGQVINAIQLWYDGLCIAQTDLVAANAVPVYTGNHVLPSPDEDSGGRILFIIIMSLLLLGALGFAGYKFGPALLRKYKKNRKRRKR